MNNLLVTQVPVIQHNNRARGAYRAIAPKRVAWRGFAAALPRSSPTSAQRWIGRPFQGPDSSVRTVSRKKERVTRT